MKRLIILIVLISTIACSDGKNKNLEYPTSKIQASINNENDKLLGFIRHTDTIKILVGFNECGEWGGHRESIYLTRNENNKIHASLQIDSVPCDKIVVVYNIRYKDSTAGVDDKARKVIFKKEKVLNENDEKLVSGFTLRLLELYLKSDFLDGCPIEESEVIIYEGSGTELHLFNTKSTINLYFINFDGIANTYYGKMRNLVFFGNLKGK